MSTTTKIKTALGRLAQLGTSDGVAEFLVAGGFRGPKFVSTDCPISLYLKAQVPEAIGLTVGACRVMWWESVDRAKELEYPLPNVVQRFISKHDHGTYPELLSP